MLINGKKEKRLGRREEKRVCPIFSSLGVPTWFLAASLLSPLACSSSTVIQKKNKRLLADYATFKAETIINTGFKITVT